MANSDTPFGFIPYRHLGGGQIRTQEFALASAYGADIYKGAPVILSSGKLAVAAQNSAAILGIFAGCSYVDSSGNQQFRNSWVTGTVTSGSADATAYVYADPMISYKVQCDGTFAIATHVGNSYDVEADGTDHTGSHVTGQSKAEIDLGDTDTGQFTVIGFINEAGNEVGASAKVEVVVNVPTVGN